MAKTKTPFMSMGAHGSVGGSITAQKRHSETLMRVKPFPTDPYSLPQAYQRWIYQDYAYLWTQQSAATQAEYRAGGSRFHLTGFQYWMKYQLTNLPGIRARWHLDEATGTVFYDSGPNNLDGDIFGTTSVSGVISRARYLDGVNDRLRVKTNPLLDLGVDDFTFEFWAKMPAQTSTWVELLNKANHDYANLTEGFCITIRTDLNWVRFVHTAAGNFGQWNNLEHAFIDDTWHLWHFLGDRSAGTVTIYRDNVDRGVRAIPNLANNISSIYHLRLGSRGGPVGRWAKGTFDNLSYYNRLLDEHERALHLAQSYQID